VLKRESSHRNEVIMFEYKSKQFIKASISEVWDFISSPKNLQSITPSYMQLRVVSDLPEKMYEGMVIAYKVRPMLRIQVTWVSKITEVVENKFFVDEQLTGPYKIWRHEHRIEEVDNGIMMTDLVTYVPPLGAIGKIANKLFIRNKIQDIFSYREYAINNKFK
jgi:ligand-binding SRPBCC domain-containing protein